MTEVHHPEFFISYATEDRESANWIASTLDTAGYSVILQDWDFRPGTDFVHKMQVASTTAERTLAVLTPAYLESAYGEAEWRVAFAKDPSGDLGLLVPVRVLLCDPPGLLLTRTYVDLVGFDETVARRKLLAAVDRGRQRQRAGSLPTGAPRDLAAPSPRRRPRMIPRHEVGLVDRPDLAARLLAAVSGGGQQAVSLTCVQGAGGFGKTTSVALMCGDAAVDGLFPGGVLWTEIGHDAAGPDLASKINDLTVHLTGTRPALSDPLQAGFKLGEALDEHEEPVLLVLDDVWRDEQIRPFLLGGDHCHRLVTTRHRLRTLTGATVVEVDLMSSRQATSLLTRGVDDLPSALVDEVLEATGRWPLLLDIANRTLARLSGRGRSPAEAATIITQRLREAGPAGLDDPATSTSRDRMVAACVAVSLDALPAEVRERYLELGIFAEDTDIPLPILELLWGATAGLDSFVTEQFAHTLVDASLVVLPRADIPGVRLHDVLRAYLRTAAQPRLADHNAALLDAAAHHLPDVEGARPWWTLPDRYGYLVDHLVEHLTQAGLGHELDELTSDLRWIARRIRRSGPVAAEADLARSSGPTATVLGNAISLSAHLLVQAATNNAVDDILASRFDGVPGLQDHHRAFSSRLVHRPRLANRWPPPDQPGSALIRTIHTGHIDGVHRVVIEPDGDWLATIGASKGYGAGGDPIVRIWDPSTGELRCSLETGNSNGVERISVSPDGAWLATSGRSSGAPTVRIWSMPTGELLHSFAAGHSHGVVEMTVALDGSWLATWSRSFGESMVQIWEPLTGELRHSFDAGHPGGVSITAGSSGLVTTAAADRLGPGGDSLVRIWDPLTGGLRHSFETGHSKGAARLSVTLDGGWLVTSGSSAGDAAVRIWDLSTGKLLHNFGTGHTFGVGRICVSPDGNWLATVGLNQRFGAEALVRVWDTRTGKLRCSFDAKHPHGVRRMSVAPDGGWLATVGASKSTSRSGDSVVRIWDPLTGQERSSFDTGHARGVGSLSVAPGGGYFATTGAASGYGLSGDPVVRLYDPAARSAGDTTGSGHPDGVKQVIAGPDGGWLATVGHSRRDEDDPGVVFRDPATGVQRHRIDTGHLRGVDQMVAAPDGAWLATIANSLEDPTVRIWDPATGAQHHLIDTGHGHGIDRMFPAPDGSWFATIGGTNVFGAGGDPVAKIWDPVTGIRRHRLDTAHPDGVGQVFIAPDGGWLVTIGTATRMGGRGFGDDPLVQIWESADGAERCRVDTGHLDGVKQVLIAPGEDWLATVGHSGEEDDDPMMVIWDPGTGAQHHRIDTRHERGVGAAFPAPDGRWIVTVGAGGKRNRIGDRTVRIWDPATGLQLHGLETGHPYGVREVVIAPDGEWLATIGFSDEEYLDPKVHVWDARTGTHRHTVDLMHLTGVHHVRLAANGAWLAVADLTSVVVWDVATRQTAAMRVDGAITTMELLADDSVILGGVRGLYGFDALLS